MSPELYERLNRYGFLTIRNDLRHIEAQGVWPNGRPDWVREIQAAYRCDPASQVVFHVGWQFVAEAAIEELETGMTKVNLSTLPPPTTEELCQYRQQRAAALRGVGEYSERAKCTLEVARRVLESATEGSDGG